MSGRPLTIVSLALGLALLLAQPVISPWNVSHTSATHAGVPSATQHAASAADYGHLPLAFELNAGQADASIRFLAHGAGYTLALTPGAALLALDQPSASPARQPFAPPAQPSAAVGPSAPPSLLGMRWLDANPNPVVTGEQPLPGTVNYFVGNDPKQWHTNIPTYQQVRLHNVYPGVDLVYYGTSGQLEYDFVVAPGADPAHIALGFSGADRLGVDLLGNLSLSLPGGAIAQEKPLVYQQTASGARQPVAGGYTLAGSGRVGFALGAYNSRLPLVIDPTYKFSTYLSGSNNDYGSGVAVDASGNVYITGNTLSDDFPTSNGAFQTSNAGGWDVFVTKLNAAGTALIYSTYLGGASDDFGFGIALDTNGNAYITGNTASTNFPIANAFQGSNGGGGSDAFVTKLNAAGNALIYSTYLGGNILDVGASIALDASDNAYVTGATDSTNFPTNPPGGTSNGGYDAFVSKLNATGSAFVYSTYLGGSNSDVGTAIAVDSGGNAYVTGSTQSTDFLLVNPLQNRLDGGQDAFVTKLNAAGSLPIFSTYLGGNGNDTGFGIAVGAGGTAYVAGSTNSSDFPTVNALQPSVKGIGSAVFITKMATLPTPVFTPGVFRPSSATFYLHNSNVSGVADEGATFGAGTDVPVVGDWTGKGYDSIGVFRNGAWFLRNANTSGGANISLAFGAAGDIPVVGDWTGKGYDSVGIYRPSTGTFYLRNSNTTGGADITVKSAPPATCRWSATGPARAMTASASTVPMWARSSCATPTRPAGQT